MFTDNIQFILFFILLLFFLKKKSLHSFKQRRADHLFQPSLPLLFASNFSPPPPSQTALETKIKPKYPIRRLYFFAGYASPKIEDSDIK